MCFSSIPLSFDVFRSHVSDKNAMKRLSFSMGGFFRPWKRWKWDIGSTHDCMSGWISCPWTPGCFPFGIVPDPAQHRILVSTGRRPIQCIPIHLLSFHLLLFHGQGGKARRSWTQGWPTNASEFLCGWEGGEGERENRGGGVEGRVKTCEGGVPCRCDRPKSPCGRSYVGRSVGEDGTGVGW